MLFFRGEKSEKNKNEVDKIFEILIFKVNKIINKLTMKLSYL